MKAIFFGLQVKTQWLFSKLKTLIRITVIPIIRGGKYGFVKNYY